MIEKGLDWKKSIREAARVLKPGGRFLAVEQTTLEGESYLEYIGNLGTVIGKKGVDEDSLKNKNDKLIDEAYPTFECLGYDDVDLVLVPHVASVFVKSEDAGLTPAQRAQKESKIEQDKMA